jgi:hypothetical protein
MVLEGSAALEACARIVPGHPPNSKTHTPRRYIPLKKKHFGGSHRLNHWRATAPFLFSFFFFFSHTKRARVSPPLSTPTNISLPTTTTSPYLPPYLPLPTPHNISLTTPQYLPNNPATSPYPFPYNISLNTPTTSLYPPTSQHLPTHPQTSPYPPPITSL